MKVSVIIPTINDPHLVRTINSVWGNRVNDIEFIIVNDGGKPLNTVESSKLLKGLDISIIKIIRHPRQLGRRISINNAAAMAVGENLFILDAHCSMTQGWDIKLTQSCGDKNISYSVIRDMHPDTWKYRPGDYLHVRLNKEYTEKWWKRRTLEECQTEEESIAFTGCAWMINKDRYWQLGGYDESLGEYGWDGPEWACKIWMGKDPGRVILRTDVICGHIFGTNDNAKLYPCQTIPKEEYVKYMKDRYEDKIGKLIERFAPVPDWTEKGKEMSQKIKREIKVNRVDKHVTRDEEGKVIKKVIEYFEYIYTDNGNGPTPDEIAKKYSPKAKKIREEVWKIKDGQLQKVA